MDPVYIGLGITILINVSGIVWSFATLTAAVRELRTTTTSLGKTVDRMDHTLDKLNTRVSVIEDRQARGIEP